MIPIGGSSALLRLQLSACQQTPRPHLRTTASVRSVFDTELTLLFAPLPLSSNRPRPIRTHAWPARQLCPERCIALTCRRELRQRDYRADAHRSRRRRQCTEVSLSARSLAHSLVDSRTLACTGFPAAIPTIARNLLAYQSAPPAPLHSILQLPTVTPTSFSCCSIAALASTRSTNSA